jgi:pimeloyl-ACP methyl ester carboxylesterase
MRLTRREAGLGLISVGISCSAASARAQDRPGAGAQEGAAAAHGASPAWLTLPPTPALPAATRSGLVSINGASIFFAQFGEGPPVLLLHGGLANSNYWGLQVGELARSFTVTVMDTRGHGRSPVMSRSFSYALFAEDAAALMDSLAIPAAAVVGWSDGAITGLQLAMTRPERVTKLFAFGANSSVDGLKPGGARSRIFVAFAARCLIEYARLSPHPERWLQLVEGLRVMWRTQPAFTKQKLASIKSPTAVSDGEYDEIIKREHTEQMCAQIPGARLLIQPAVSHFAMLQDAPQFNRVLMEFLTAET